MLLNRKLQTKSHLFLNFKNNLKQIVTTYILFKIDERSFDI